MNNNPLSGKDADKFIAWLEKNFHAFLPTTTIEDAKIVYEKRLLEKAAQGIGDDEIVPSA